jgi:thiol-disulfide isomerase/thioredoxin
MAQIVALAEFEAVLEKLMQASTRALILVTSDKNLDGSYWCPDCEAIKPLYPIFEQESKAAALPYFIFVAGDRPTWKNPENPLRKHKALLIKSVPTLGLFDGKKLSRRLVEAEILDQAQRTLIYE